MKITSEYVKNNLDINMIHQDLLVSIRSLNNTLRFGNPSPAVLFQALVYNTIVNNVNEWQHFADGKWVEHTWGLTKKEIVNDTKVENLKPGVLYYIQFCNLSCS